jgi:alpha-N-arabinofuranosidase
MKKIFSLFPALILLMLACTEKQPEVSFINPSMELIENGKPVGWDSIWWRTPARHMVSETAHDGRYSLCISSREPGFGSWFTKVKIQPFSTYKISAWIKTDSLEPGTGKGAAFLISNEVEPKYFAGTTDWTLVEYEYSPGWDDSMQPELVFGMDGLATGSVWMDDLRIELVSQQKVHPSVAVDITKEGAPMEKYIYGQFIEHLGRCIYGGIWSEMIKDRKFFYAPGAEESPWTILGEGTRVDMKRESGFGKRPNLVLKTGEAGGGIVQSQIGLRKGIDCEGRVVVKKLAGPGKIQLILCWGNEPEASQTVTIECPGKGFQAYGFTFHPDSTTLEGSFQILLPGKGEAAIAAVSLMPYDNIDGFRADVIALLRELNAPVYRWPGGNFVSGYDWRDGLGDPDLRPARKNPAWEGIEPNDVGINEFMRFCDLVHADPYISVNAGLGDAGMAANEIEYVNGSAETPMGKLRVKNGHPDPFGVKFWSIGNEMYGDWQLGHMPTEAFTKKHNQIVDAMRKVDPTFKAIAVGDLGEWDKAMLANCADHMDFISEHFYKQDWHGGGLISHVRQIPDAIREKTDAHRKYREEIPSLAGENIRICMDEWNYWYGPYVFGELGTRYFLRDGLGIAAGIHEYSRQSDIIYMANYAQTVNVIGCIKTTDIASSFESTGLVLKLYRRHFGTIPLALDETYRPLDVAATLTDGRDTLCLGIVNPTHQLWKLPVSMGSARVNGLAELFSLTGPDEMSYNDPGKEPVLKIDGPQQVKMGKKLSIPPVSVVIYRIPIKK